MLNSVLNSVKCGSNPSRMGSKLSGASLLGSSIGTAQRNFSVCASQKLQKGPVSVGIWNSMAKQLPTRSSGPSFTSSGRSARFFTTTTTTTQTTKEGDMFCFQCEQTQNGTGCTTIGVCGKTPEVAALQDLFVHQMRQLCAYTYIALKNDGPNEKLQEITDFVLQGLYSTLTNVNFDPSRFLEFLRKAHSLTKDAKELAGKELAFAHTLNLAKDLENGDIEGLVAEGKLVGVLEKMKSLGTDVASLQELLQYGLKGYAAYAREAQLLGQTDQAVFDFMIEAMGFLSGVKGLTPYDPNDSNSVLSVALKCGEMNIRVMELLDKGGNDRFGHPTPTKVLTRPVPGKCIAVSGHDLGDLNAILQQTEGTGINVYTHGELLPAHGYPKLKQYKHLVGNYGGAWQLQKLEFSKFPGPVIMTTNCIIEPRKQYKDRIYTTGVVGWPDVPHITNRDFSSVIKRAMECEGFTEKDATGPETFVTTGFGHHFVLNIADIIINAVKRGDVQRFFLIGGCDGSEGERNYYKELATSLPKDNVILTLGCAKYRFNKLDHGTIQTVNPRDNSTFEIPRLLDMGQCNDAFSAVKVASALANAFGTTDLNQLPLSFAISWFEQKAVVIFLTLMHLGIKNVRIGPVLPAFVPPSTLQFLVDKLNVSPIHAKSVQQDMNVMLQGK